MIEAFTTFEAYRSYWLYAIAGLALFIWQFVLTDILRIIQYAAFRLGYKRGSGKGVIPGPLEDTRTTRYAYENQVGIQYRQQYGRLYRTFCGGIPEIVLSDPEDIKVYYSGDFKHHDKIENIGLGDYADKLIGQAVGAKSKDDWRRLRSSLDPHFNLDKGAELLPLIVSCTEDWLRKLPQSAVTERDEKNGRIIVKAEELGFEIPPKVIAHRLFGELLDDKFGAELHAMNQIHERIMARVFLSKWHHYKIYKYLPIEANREMKKFCEDRNAMLVQKCNEAEERGIKTTISDLYNEVKAGRLSFDEFAHSIDEILFANLDITPTAISWTVSELAMDPAVQARLYEEIKAASSDASLGATPEERRIAYVRKSDTLLHYTYLEAARLRPIFCYSFSGTTHDAKIMNGYYIPPKTSIVVDGYTLNRTASTWGDDPNVFRPDRFVGLSPAEYRYSLFRFGIGPRKCIAQYFADKLVKAVVAGIVEKYHVQLKDNHIGPNPKMFFYAPKGTLIFTPRDGKKL